MHLKLIYDKLTLISNTSKELLENVLKVDWRMTERKESVVPIIKKSIRVPWKYQK